MLSLKKKIIKLHSYMSNYYFTMLFLVVSLFKTDHIY